MDPSAVSDVKSIPFTCAPDRKKAVTGSPAEREASSPVRLLLMRKMCIRRHSPAKTDHQVRSSLESPMGQVRSGASEARRGARRRRVLRRRANSNFCVSTLDLTPANPSASELGHCCFSLLDAPTREISHDALRVVVLADWRQERSARVVWIRQSRSRSPTLV